ncbi:FAD-binding oxidoreductase [Frankia sp. CNm7]|uniref:FAD-binding oxidoreductase n=1 Tax=Frankia nepalensis TaxID=1836974 RepID=A0A937RCF4_9ACTN|nr:FAD-binding protein [Frankia nepalensis]MBL7502618.1 FAD-binding oxidoreductase [Frankia nepalensis]MBL7514796.1 FAD-binding oxidoreductase [Frankia nepalensis]MBL7522857.1 FAD-binding oxidoreductase [Frankia nepalensis]MBL7629553.1 FAD-binding oxidoreductase [Frankia nepalensis]
MSTLAPNTPSSNTASPNTAAPNTASLDVALAALAETIRGQVLLPGSGAYAAAATPWNVAVPTTPVAVVAVADASDVVAAVRFANAHDLDVVVQATGHGALATTRPSLMIYTGGLDEVTVDPARRLARVGAGARWQRVLDAAAEHGLGALAGSAPHVGVVGYLTGGGLSPVARTFGYGSDLVTAFDVVTGDGERRRATATENPALFWGLRGGKGALGVVTAVEFELLDAAQIYGGCLYFDGADADRVVSAWKTWSAALPEQASTSIAVLRLPPMPAVPAPLAGRCTVAVRFAWIGDPAAGERVIDPIRGLATVIFGGLGVLPFPALGMIHADPVDPMPVHEQALLLRELPDAAVRALLALTGPEADCPQVIVELRLLGGALAREPRQLSAVCHRDAAYSLLTIGIAAPPLAAPTAAHAAEVMAALEPWSGGLGAPNFGATTDPALVARKYDAATLSRLATLTASYDPNSRMAAAHPVRAAAALLARS